MLCVVYAECWVCSEWCIRVVVCVVCYVCVVCSMCGVWYEMCTLRVVGVVYVVGGISNISIC